MNSGETIVIASTSDGIIDYVCQRLGEIGTCGKIYRAASADALRECLTAQCPRLLLIEGCFWHNATPDEILNLVGRYGGMRIYAFGIADYRKEYIRRLIRTGIEGYINVRKGRSIFREELKMALSGKVVIPPEFENEEPDCLPKINYRLTNNDMKLISLIIEENDNKGIARALNLADQTVRNRRAYLYAKMNVYNTIGLLKLLFRMGILTINDFLSS